MPDSVPDSVLSVQDKDPRTTCEFLSTEIIICVLVYVHVDSSLVQGCHALCSIKKCKREKGLERLRYMYVGGGELIRNTMCSK